MPSKILSWQTDAGDETRKKGLVMEDGVAVDGYWFWALASSIQLAAGVASYRRGYRGRETLMPVKAFAVASLFVGAGASALIGLLQASGIRSVDDLKEVGASTRRRMGIPPREESK